MFLHPSSMSYNAGEYDLFISKKLRIQFVQCIENAHISGWIPFGIGCHRKIHIKASNGFIVFSKFIREMFANYIVITDWHSTKAHECLRMWRKCTHESTCHHVMLKFLEIEMLSNRTRYSEIVENLQFCIKCFRNKKLFKWNMILANQYRFSFLSTFPVGARRKN